MLVLPLKAAVNALTGTGSGAAQLCPVHHSTAEAQVGHQISPGKV